jgi:hypothetical protein
MDDALAGAAIFSMFVVMTNDGYSGSIVAPCSMSDAISAYETRPFRV